MKLFLLLSILFITDFAPLKNSNQKIYMASVVPVKMSVAKKKERFFHLLVPAVDKVHGELMTQYEKISKDIKSGKNLQKIKELKTFYKAKTDKELLSALKPHRKSITLAQAALESSWATSRFFIKANNIFGVHSIDENEPRIVAGENKNVWLKKFDTIEESVRNYYKFIAIGTAYKEFREARLNKCSIEDTLNELCEYSEIGEEYPKILNKIILHNNLASYDD
jgi:Bax protein